MTTPTVTEIESPMSEIIKASASLAGPQWLRERRAIFAQQFAEMSLPTSAEELWRYSDIDNFRLDNYHALDLSSASNEKSSPGGGIAAAEAGEHSALIVVRDGRVVHQSIDEDLANKGVIVVGLAEADDGAQQIINQYLGSVAGDTSDAFTVLNEAMLAGGAFIFVPQNVVCDKPIVILHWCEGENIAVFPRTLVIAEKNSHISIIERFESSNETLFIDSVTECVVEDNAHLRFLTAQENGKFATHIGFHRTHVKRDGRFESSTVSLGSKYARHRGEVALLGEGATSDVMAVYYGDHEQVLDFRTFQDHRAPHTTSNLLFKGAVEDTARSVYSGLIRIREDAQKSEALQTNRNLVLDHGAQAESIPNLMIEANDVKCAHGSTVGPIDDEQMYYLATRGVSPRDAEKLIVLGFFEDVFSRLSVPALIEPLRRSVNEKLSKLAVKHEDSDD